MAGQKQSPVRKLTSERKTTTEQQDLAALLEQGKGVMRAAGLIVTSRILDSPVAVNMTPIHQLRADPMLWGAGNQDGEVHEDMAQLMVRGVQVSALPTSPPQVQVQVLPTPITQNESIPHPPPVFWPGVNPYLETTECTGLAECQQWAAYWAYHNEQRLKEVTSEATTASEPPKSPIQMPTPSWTTVTLVTNTAPISTMAGLYTNQPSSGPQKMRAKSDITQRIRDIERLNEYYTRKRQRRLKNLIISQQYQLHETSQLQYSQSPPLREELVAMETNEPTLEVSQTSKFASMEHLVSRAEPTEMGIFLDPLLYESDSSLSDACKIQDDELSFVSCVSQPAFSGRK